MPITLAGAVLNGLYSTNLLFVDQASEKARKISRLYNAGNAGNMAAALNVLAAVSHAGISSASVKQALEVDLDAEPNITLSGLYTLVNIRLILGFERVHPLNPGKMITAGYAIPAPVNTIVTATNPKRPLYVRGVSFGAAATDPERLGALIDWLETALTYEAANGQIYSGGWTFVDSRSGLGTVTGVIDGDIRT